MKNTLRMSEMIRKSQLDLIASIKPSASSVEESDKESDSLLYSSPEDDKEDKEKEEEEEKTKVKVEENDGNERSQSPLSVRLEDSELRVAPNALKRQKVPAPLNLSKPKFAPAGPATGYALQYHPHSFGPATAVDGALLAPMRSQFPKFRARPIYHRPGARVPVTPVPYCRMVPAARPNVPQIRVRSAGGAPPTPHPKPPVQDVFRGAVAQAAPLPLQPPLAQIERFGLAEKPDDSPVHGSISFNDSQTFTFKMLRPNLLQEEKKRKFLQICETVWDRWAQ